LARAILFASSSERTDTNDIDIGVIGLAPESFFDFCWEWYRDLSKPLDVIDLGKNCLFNELAAGAGMVLYS